MAKSRVPGKASKKAAAKPRATRAATKGKFVLVDPAGQSRLLVTLIGNYIHRIEVERRRMYFNDLDLARVAEVIALRGVEPGMRDAAYRERYSNYDKPIGVDEVGTANASSIAIATGYPRETVRRMLRKLLDLGFIIEKSRAEYVINPGAYLKPDMQASVGRGLQETALFINEAISQGLIRWVPE